MSGPHGDSVVTDAGGAILKTHRLEADLTRSPGVRARHEFDVLNRLRAVLPPAFTVPRTLQLDETNGSLMMERAPGVPLDRILSEGKRRPDAVPALTEPVRRAGEWLRALQAATGKDSLPGRLGSAAGGPDAREVLAAQTALAIRDAEATLRGRLQRRVVARLRELQSHVAQSARITCGHHGDYWPGNVFLAPGPVTVIDFEGYREGLPLEDVAYFLIELELLLPRHARSLPALRVAFVDGYGGIGDPDALMLFTLTKTLRLLALDGASKHSLLIALWIRRTLRRIMDRCLTA